MLDIAKVYLFRKGKNGAFISHDDYGKIIIGKNCTTPGFYKIRVKKELHKCYIADVIQKVLYDYYGGMTYEEFKELLSFRGYAIAFEMPFTTEYYGNGEKVVYGEKRLVAYSKKLNMIIVADTFSQRNTFDSIECYCYGTNAFDFINHKMLSFGSDDVAVFDLSRDASEPEPLHKVEESCSPDTDLSQYQLKVPSGWTYDDAPETEEDFANYEKMFLELCPPELKAWFGH